jgi:uncharacterized protein
VKNLITTIAVVFSIAIMLPRAGIADFQKGMNAAQSGDYASAIKEWEFSAEQGDMEAQFALGWSYKVGIGVTKNNETAFKWIGKAASQGHPEAQQLLGEMYLNGNGVTKNFDLGIKLMLLAAENGNAKAQFVMGLLMTKGKGKNIAEAIRWYEKAAEQAFPDAMFNLGVIFRRGEGVSKDLIRSFKWFLLAKSLGFKGAEVALNNVAKLLTTQQINEGQKQASDFVSSNMAQKVLGGKLSKNLKYNKGYFLEQKGDIKGAIALYKDAAAEGSFHAQYSLAQIYRQGTGVQQDAGLAFRWLNIAADNGNPALRFGDEYAIVNATVGAHFEQGVEVGKSVVKAKQYYFKACEIGDQPACERLKVLGATLPEQQTPTTMSLFEK